MRESGGSSTGALYVKRTRMICREDGIAGAFDRDVADVRIAKHTSSAERRGKTLSLYRFWNWLHHRAPLMRQGNSFQSCAQLVVEYDRSPGLATADNDGALLEC